ncbi:exodeoxyribonuclease VII large subunit [Alkalimarinus sediminis]|uniref:Exodeoxyribonuclease 7 large subunit n=1 Tax=Alkalimarinus sediminis TaxID=1632866 RepID=A0A9E8HJZ5_9ALTE|nr:exodeoxyribonuclease VII large subunit [Alkalimarinus sediminis]UZW75804.1 exodeoxyribonuclease VII large subunit [Alkalimarinus sediminis]
MQSNSFEDMAKKRVSLTVSELNRQVKQLLEASFLQTWVEGELTSFSKPSSGHWYFTLKDNRAQIRCAMFKGHNQRLRFTPKEGDKVVVRAKVSLYEGRGDYQLIVETMEPAGAGDLQKAYEQLKAKLAAEGLFDQTRKQPLPSLPKRIAVVTSPTGAAIHDILTVLNRRFPHISITIYPTAVQGDGAAADIARMIKLANQRKEADMIIVGRGGGSLEDLWAFNEEVVARAIFESSLPIVSAVGHEIDFTIADFVSDYRAPTPSAAAEKISPDQYEWSQNLDHLMERIQHAMRRKLATERQKVDAFSSHIKHPGKKLQEHKARLNELNTRLTQSQNRHLTSLNQAITALQQRLYSQSPAEKIVTANKTLKNEFQKLTRAMQHTLDSRQQQLVRNIQTLEAVSPLATISRGYAIVSNNQNPVIRSISDVKEGEHLKTKLSDGYIHSQVVSTEPSNR